MVICRLPKKCAPFGTTIPHNDSAQRFGTRKMKLLVYENSRIWLMMLPAQKLFTFVLSQKVVYFCAFAKNGSETRDK